MVEVVVQLLLGALFRKSDRVHLIKFDILIDDSVDHIVRQVV